jgi:RNA polymerase sigma factor (TIGR02999 family)
VHDLDPSHSTAAALSGDLKPALGAILPLLYADLRRMAHAQRFRFGGPATLGTTAVVHELYLKFVRASSLQSVDRGHFFALAARTIRQILTDHARERQARKPLEPIADDASMALAVDPETLLDIDRALTQLGQLQPRWVEVVNCRYFAGYSDAETAELLGVNERTVRRDWLKARAWLGAALSDDRA